MCVYLPLSAPRAALPRIPAQENSQHPEVVMAAQVAVSMLSVCLCLSSSLFVSLCLSVSPFSAPLNIFIALSL